MISAFTFGDGPANSGDPVSTMCTVIKGDFPMKINWKHNGDPIGYENRDISISKISRHMSVISIESVSARHAGEFTCVATNGAGSMSQSAMLIVNGMCPREKLPKIWLSS